MKDQDQKNRFQTHIREPRWQQVVSVIGVLILVGLWLLLVFHP